MRRRSTTSVKRPPTDSTVSVLARVVWVDQLPAGSPARYDVGVEFLDVPEEMRSRLGAVLDRETEIEATGTELPIEDEDGNAPYREGDFNGLFVFG